MTRGTRIGVERFVRTTRIKASDTVPPKKLVKAAAATPAGIAVSTTSGSTYLGESACATKKTTIGRATKRSKKNTAIRGSENVRIERTPIRKHAR
jgi:hypothetical protein